MADSEIAPVHQRLSSHSAPSFIENKRFYHQNCYSFIVNKTKLERVEKRFYKAQDTNDVSLVTPKRGRPSIDLTPPPKLNENESYTIVNFV